MKPMKSKFWMPVAGLALLLAGFSACQKAVTNGSNGPSRLDIYLTDGPGNFQAVWIDVQQVMVKASSDSSDQGWISVPLLKPGMYNLLALSNGKDTILGGVSLPAGKVSQIRLILGDSNSVVLEDGTVVPLKTPSAQQSGLKLNIDASLTAGIPYALVLDFDAARSIVKAGNSGKYILKPVIRTFARAAGGAIQGVVLPDSAKAHVIAISGADTLGAIPDNTGFYKFWGIAVGNYKLIFAPDTATHYKADTLQNIAVTIGNVTTIDTVKLVH